MIIRVRLQFEIRQVRHVEAMLMMDRARSRWMRSELTILPLIAGACTVLGIIFYIIFFKDE